MDDQRDQARGTVGGEIFAGEKARSEPAVILVVVGAKVVIHSTMQDEREKAKSKSAPLKPKGAAPKITLRRYACATRLLHILAWTIRLIKEGAFAARRIFWI